MRLDFYVRASSSLNRVFPPFDFLDSVRNRVVEAYPRNMRIIASGDADVRSRPWLGVPSPVLVAEVAVHSVHSHPGSDHIFFATTISIHCRLARQCLAYDRGAFRV